MLYNIRFTGFFRKNLPVISQRFSTVVGYRA
jgi:hypothetical protein